MLEQLLHRPVRKTWKSVQRFDVTDQNRTGQWEKSQRCYISQASTEQMWTEMCDGWRPQMGEMIIIIHRFVAQTSCFCARRLFFGVTTIDDVIWGNRPQTPPKSRVNRQFQVKIIINIAILWNDKSDPAEIWGQSSGPPITLRGWSTITPKANPTWLTAVNMVWVTLFRRS